MFVLAYLFILSGLKIKKILTTLRIKMVIKSLKTKKPMLLLLV